MPCETLSFRAKCGSFLWIYMNFMYKRTLDIFVVPTLRLRTKLAGVMAGLLLTQFFCMDLLQQCGDIEPNPGPAKSMRQSTLRSCSDPDVSPRKRPVSPAGEKEHNIADIVKTMTDMAASLSSLNSKMDAMACDMRHLRDDFATLKGRTEELQEEVDVLKQENINLKEDNVFLKSGLDGVNRKIDDLEGRSKRNNLIFYGLNKLDGETSEECEGMLEDFITDKLELGDKILFDRVHRLNSKPNGPVIA